jgi:hypothetical protein
MPLGLPWFILLNGCLYGIVGFAVDCAIRTKGLLRA